MKIEKLLNDFSIEYITSGNKHCSPGWVNIHCPFCEGSRNYHLGYSLNDNFFKCWRCGWHSIIETLSKLLGMSNLDAKRLVSSQYEGPPFFTAQEKLNIHPKIKGYKLPSGTLALNVRHRHYLIERGFNPEKLEQDWGILGTGPISLLDNHDYKHRIIAPIFWQGKPVSFQARDVTGKSDLRYKACPKDREEVLHQNILYARKDIHTNPPEVLIVVEGITDAWRLGAHNTVALFGMEFSQSQINALIRIVGNRKRIMVVFDNEQQAKMQAKKLMAELRMREIKTWSKDILTDPGDMPQREADQLIDAIGGK